MLLSSSRCAVRSTLSKKRFNACRFSRAKRSLSAKASRIDGSQGSTATGKVVTASCLLLMAASIGIYEQFSVRKACLEAEEEDETTMLLNWSGTHAVSVPNDCFWEPETVEELEAVVKYCHEHRKPVRPLGSALSPNGIAFHPGGMVSLTNLDKVIKVDKEAMTVTVQAGARVSQVRGCLDRLVSRFFTYLLTLKY